MKTTQKLYKEPILEVVGSDGTTILFPQSVVCAVIIEQLAYRASKRIRKDMKDAVKDVLLYSKPIQPTKEMATRMVKKAAEINKFFTEQCDEIKQIFLDLVSRRYTELATLHP